MGTDNAFDNLGTSTARYGCCPASKYMSSPEGTGIFVEADSCSACPVGTFTSIPNDETSCQLCASGTCSAAGSASCSTCSKLPNGNGQHVPSLRVGDTLGRIVDDILGKSPSWIVDISKRDAAIAKYGLFEYWDVSEVTDMSYLFTNKNTFNADLSAWVVSQVTTMQGSTWEEKKIC